MIDAAPAYYTYNEANQLETEKTAAGTVYYHHDGCGNTTAEQAAGGTTYFQYNTENLLTRIDFPAGGGHSYYTYDGNSKRVSQRTADGYTGFVYQGPDMLALQLERNEAGTTQAHYTIGRGLESVRRSTTSHFYHYNHLGTTLALTASNQTVSDTYHHDAWGVLLSSTGSTVNPHTYVGRARYYRMANADLYHLGFRDYAQALGRFMTVDPSGRAVNRMVYVSNLPLGRVDPAGLQGICLTQDATNADMPGLAYSRGPRFTARCSGHIQSQVGIWCDHLASLTIRQLAMVNDCIRCNAKHMGIFCMYMSTDPRLDCMRKWCDGQGRVTCSDEATGECLAAGLPCAYVLRKSDTRVLYSCQIVFCVPRVEWNERCLDDSDKTIPRVAFNFLHELAHCCGIQHAAGASRRSCNDVWACCIWNVVTRGRWQKPSASDKQGCRYW